MKLCFCLNCCCPEILCLSDSPSVCLLFMSVSPCWVGGNISLSLFLPLSLSYSPTPLSSLPTSAGFRSKHHNCSPQWDDGPTPRHAPPIFTHCPLTSFLAPSSAHFPHIQNSHLSGHSVWLNIDKAFRLDLPHLDKCQKLPFHKPDLLLKSKILVNKIAKLY